jgi:hypothetical protein
MDVMIDLECLDTSPDCAILTIGIVIFDPKKDGIIDKLELKPTLEDQTEIYNRSISSATLDWWSQQDIQALDEAFNESDRLSFRTCMEKLYKFCWNRNKVWSNGAAFDVVVCEHALKQTLTEYPNPIPWPFYNVRDTRTIYDIAGVSLKDDNYKTVHKAVADSERQAIIVQRAYKKLMDKGFCNK